jgi:predicted negative regulator of RcsB-dependent stress response
MSKEILNNNFQYKIKFFLNKNLKSLIILSICLILILFGYFFYKDLQEKKGIELSEAYTQASVQFNKKETQDAKKLLKDIINKKHKFYSPMALYFLIDNNLEINSIDQENLNLIKIKKAIFLFKLGNEEAMLTTLNPIVNSDSAWRKMAIELISDYFISKNQTVKASEYIQLLNSKNNK